MVMLLIASVDQNLRFNRTCFGALGRFEALRRFGASALFKDRACLHFPMQWNLKYQIKEIAFWISDGMFSTYI